MELNPTPEELITKKDKILLKPRSFLKKSFFRYQRFMWFVAVAGNEIGKPFRFVAELGIILLLLSDSGISTNLTTKIITYIILVIVAGLFGYLIAKMGIIKYTTTLNNEHNEELKEILDRVRKLEKKD